MTQLDGIFDLVSLINREQRLDLFIKLGKWGLNSYLYAPKVTIEKPQ